MTRSRPIHGHPAARASLRATRPATLRERFRATLPATRRGALAALLAAATFGCGEREDWSPLDGPWDPDHPEAAGILAAPAPDAPIDREMAAAGERWYRLRGCLACHTLEGNDVLGPTLEGVSRRRDYEWFRGMVMRPDSMLREDAVARELLEIYRVPMPNQGVSDLHTRAIWEYLRMRDRAR